MVRPKRDAPCESSPQWPAAKCVDPVAEVMRVVAINLAIAIGDRSLRSVSVETGVPHTVISSILSGGSWVEAATIARLEIGLGCRLWPDVG